MRRDRSLFGSHFIGWGLAVFPLWGAAGQRRYRQEGRDQAMSLEITS